MLRPLTRITIFFFFLLTLAVKSTAQTAGDYRSVATGTWAALATWQSYNGASWVAAASAPNSTSGVITISAGNTVTIGAAVTVDQVVVNGTLVLNNFALTVANGAGDDLIINGTFQDNATTSVTFSGSAWSMAPGATLLKTAGSASNNWQAAYSGGIANIPATANWILRKTAASNPQLSTTGAIYPNLTIENNTGAGWTTSAGSTFTGTTSAPLIKGNLNVGGSGTNTVDFLMNCTSAAGNVIVQGNFFLKAGSTIRNYGNGIEADGDVTVNGTISYDANDGRNFVMGGGNTQTISGTGTFNIYNFTMNKTANNATLARAITVDNLTTFTNGILFTTSTNLLSIASTGSVTGASNNSFVSGPVRSYVSTGLTFPVGKNSDYQPLTLGSYTPSGGSFWTETFNNGCSSLCTAAAYSGANGAWTVNTSLGLNDPTANQWYVSCAENGNAVGTCGSGCAGNATLHVGNVSGSPSAFFFCPSGDCGAAFDAGGFGTDVRTDKRAESPTINCSGKTTITLSFKYIQTGALPNDACTIYYFDGSVWSLIANPPATNNAGCAGQGKWTAYSVALPASADNNPNVKVGFRWINNDDGVGNDPSFAVDDVTLSTAPESFTCEYFYSNPQVAYNNNLAGTLGSISGCEYWVLDRLPVTSTAAATVLLNWDANSCPVIPLISDTRVAHFDGTTWQDEGNGGNTGSTAAGTVVSASAVTYFSPFTIGLIPSAPLPVELIGFSGQCETDAIKLQWKTESEQNNNYFTIERSTDGIAFTEIAHVNGAGNSDQLLDYTYTDKAPGESVNYYRISQTDFNGHREYFNTIAVDKQQCGKAPQLAIDQFNANAENLQLFYSGARGVTNAEIYSTDGKLVYSTQTNDGNLQIPLTNLGTGLYFIRLTDGYSSISKSFFH